jgi:hypothetical protein
LQLSSQVNYISYNNAPVNELIDKSKFFGSKADIINIFFIRTFDEIKLQFDRIKQDIDDFATLSASMSGTKIANAVPYRYGSEPSDLGLQQFHRINTAIFTDVHMLLIALQQLNDLLECIIKKKLLPDVIDFEQLQIKYKNWLKTCTDFRNHLEHISERVVRGVSDLGNIINDSFSFDGETISIGPDQERMVEQFANDYFKIINKLIAQRSPRGS